METRGKELIEEVKCCEPRNETERRLKQWPGSKEETPRWRRRYLEFYAHQARELTERMRERPEGTSDSQGYPLSPPMDNKWPQSLKTLLAMVERSTEKDGPGSGTMPKRQGGQTPRSGYEFPDQGGYCLAIFLLAEGWEPKAQWNREENSPSDWKHPEQVARDRTLHDPESWEKRLRVMGFAKRPGESWTIQEIENSLESAGYEKEEERKRLEGTLRQEGWLYISEEKGKGTEEMRDLMKPWAWRGEGWLPPYWCYPLEPRQGRDETFKRLQEKVGRENGRAWRQASELP